MRASGSSGARFYVAGRVAEGTGDGESHVWGRRNEWLGVCREEVFW